MFLNSHNVNSNSNSNSNNANQNHTNTGTHRSRKEKLICRSIVTTEPISLPGVEAAQAEPVPANRRRNTVICAVGNVGGSNVQGPGGPCPTSVIVPTPQSVKIKNPRKPKTIVLPAHGAHTNGTGIYEGMMIPPIPTVQVTAKLPKRMKLDTVGQPTSGIVNGSPKKAPRKPPTPKTPKEKKPKVPKVRPVNSVDKPKRKYTKRKNVDVRAVDDQFPNIARPSPSLFTSAVSIPKVTRPKPGEVVRLNYPTRILPPSPIKEDPRWGGQRVSLLRKQPILPGGEPGRKGSSVSEKRDMRVPSVSNTHLLLSPQTLKRMLRSPSPATQNSSLGMSDEELDDEIIEVSNSLFKDMSLNRQQKTPSPESSYTSSSSTTSSSPQGRGRYSRRKFGRLYPPFDPNHCVHPHCVEGTLTGSKYCGSHVNGHLGKTSFTGASVYGQCTYTDPLSLKPCNQTVYGEDDREFRFCDVHSARVSATRLRIHRRERVEEKEETMDSLLNSLEESVKKRPIKKKKASNFPPPSATVTQDGPAIPLSPKSEAKEREELLKDFLNERNARASHRSRNLQLFSRFQPDEDSDEDTAEAGEDDPLRHAGYYSTGEVSSIYRSRLVKLRSLYASQFSVLKNAYMEFRHKCVEEQEKNELRKFSFTCDPKYIGVLNVSLEKGFKEKQMDARERSLALMKYHHRFGARKVVQFRAMQEFEKQKTEPPRGRARMENETEVSNSGGDGEDGVDESAEFESPYNFLLSMNHIETKRSTENASGETGDLTKGSLSAAQAELIARQCIYRVNSDAPKCTNVHLPLTKYCKGHILLDENQVMVGKCGRVLSADTQDTCQNPVIIGFQKNGCKIHRIAEVMERKPSEEEVEEAKEDLLSLGFADSEEELDVLEELVARETFDMKHFDRAVKYLDEKGFAVPDTDESDNADDDEEDEEFKNLLQEELLLKVPLKKGGRRTKGKKDEKKLMEPRPPLMVRELDNGYGDSDIALRYLPLLPLLKGDELDDPEPCLVLNPAE